MAACLWRAVREGITTRRNIDFLFGVLTTGIHRSSRNSKFIDQSNPGLKLQYPSGYAKPPAFVHLVW
jgi:hypothetical protein